MSRHRRPSGWQPGDLLDFDVFAGHEEPQQRGPQDGEPPIAAGHFRSPAAAGPTRTSKTAGTSRVLTIVGALIAGFLLATGIAAGRDVVRQQDARKADLLALLEMRQERNDAMSQQLEDLRLRVSEAEVVLTRDAPALASQVEQMESLSGLTRMSGPGLRVSFSDGPPACSHRPQDCRIQDADLQLAVNTLFAVGAEAVAVNGERLIATTAIRSAGGSILVNYTVLTSPYVVEAIGDPVQMHARFADSGLAADFEVWRDTYGLGFGVEQVTAAGAGGLVLPAHSGSVQLQEAEVPS